MKLQEQLIRIQSMMGLINEDENKKTLSKQAKIFQQEIESQGLVNFLLNSHLDINDLAKTFKMSLLELIKELFVGKKLSTGIIPGENDFKCDFIIDSIGEGEFNTIIFNITIVGGQVTFDADGWLDEPGTYDLFDPQIYGNEVIWYDIKYNMVDTLEWFFQTLFNKEKEDEYNVEIKLKIKRQNQ